MLDPLRRRLDLAHYFRGLHMSIPCYSLDQLGWRPAHAQQLTLQELEIAYPARVTAVHRSGFATLSERGETDVIASHDSDGNAITVGDWLLIEQEAPRILRALPRLSVITRMAAGTAHRPQPIAANLDTLLVVTSCNDDFNLSRLERYLSVALEAQVEPVIVLTKIDQCVGRDIDRYIEQVRSIASASAILPVNATSLESVQLLSPWLYRGQTIAFVGSSGVGKSTLVNTLTGTSTQATAGIREDDSRGRHTTTARQMYALPGGAWVIDTPGMRELKIGAVEDGVSRAFEDIDTLAGSCRFRDCTHEGDVGCAVVAAVADGRLDERRFVSFLKLRREAQNASRTVRERRELERQFGRVARSAQRRKRQLKGRDG